MIFTLYQTLLVLCGMLQHPASPESECDPNPYENSNGSKDIGIVFFLLTFGLILMYMAIYPFYKGSDEGHFGYDPIKSRKF